MAEGKVDKQVAFAGAGTHASQSHPGDSLYRGFVADPTLSEVPIEPRLDCSEEALGDDKELWLMQLPLDLDLSKAVQWKVDRSGCLEGLRAHCSVDGKSYEMVPEREATSVPLYVTASTRSGRLSKVARRLTVLRTTDAPQICFGQAHKEIQQRAPSIGKLPAEDQATLAKKSAKKTKLQLGTPAVPVISEPRQAVPPAAAEPVPSKSNLTAYGGRVEQQQLAAVAAAAGSEGAKKKKKKKRDGEEGGGEGERLPNKAKKEKNRDEQ